MSNYAYVAVDPRGTETRGMLEVSDASEAIRRIKEMGLFPTKLLESREREREGGRRRFRRSPLSFPAPGLGGKVRSSTLTIFTRQLSTLIEAGMPLLRGLRTLRQQEENRVMQQVLDDLAAAIEGGNSLAEALSMHPKVFNRLYINMVRAGELGGVLELTLGRLAECMEKAQRIRGKIKAALFYPCAVLVVAMGILAVMLAYVVPRFKGIFEGLMNGLPMPPFTQFILRISEGVQHHVLGAVLSVLSAGLLLWFLLRTQWGRWGFDYCKLALPILGPVFRKVAISRFARTLGTMVSSGVPILQALTIVKETAGNVLVGALVSRIHENVKQGDPIAPTLRASRLFPAMVAGMVDVGEQTGALPEMLMKVADQCDEEVDNAASAMTSLLEPILIVFLAVVVGSIVVAMFLPLVKIMDVGFDHSNSQRGGE